MKFPGGNQLLFCEQVSTVTSFFEQWNDCERTVVLYALLKRVPFANLKFLQLSIDYNLAQNYSSQTKLQLLETHANNANFLNKLVQRYQNTTAATSTTSASSCCVVEGVTAGETNATTTLQKNNNNNNTSIANNNLTISDSGYADLEKKNSTHDLSSNSSSSCSSSSGVSSSRQTASSLSLSSFNNDHQSQQEHNSGGGSKDKPPLPVAAAESKKDILNDMLSYLPLLKPGSDDVKSVYMSLIPAAVEDACQQAVPTELVQHILSYLLIHPAINNDDRRSLSYWLRHLEEHISTSYIPTTLASSAATATNINISNNSKSNNNNATKMVNSNSTFFIHPPTPQLVPHQQRQQQSVDGSNQNLTSKTSSQQSLQFLSTGSWHHLQPQLPHQHPNNTSSNSSSCNKLPQQPQSVCISNSSLLSKSQQSLNQANSSSSSSSSCLDSTSSLLLKSNNLLGNLDWTIDVKIKSEDVDGGTVGGDSNGNSGGAVRSIGSSENVSIKEFVPVTFNYSNQPQHASSKPIGNSSGVSSAGVTTAPTINNNNTSKHHPLNIASSSQASGVLLGGSSSSATSGSDSSSLNLSSSGGGGGSSLANTAMVVMTDLDSSDDNHLSFSKNGIEIFDYDCDYDTEEEFNYLSRVAAAVAAGGGSSTTSGGTGGGNINAPGGPKAAAGSASVPSSGTARLVGAAAPNTSTTGSSNSGSTKNRVSFDANVNDFLRVPPIGSMGEFDLDGSGLLKTRRSNSLTMTASGTFGLPVRELHQQKQNNECLSAENLTNLQQLLQNKPRSFSLTMESPRSSLTSSGSETRLDDFKQKQMMKMYGSPNVGMSSIAHWLKSLRLHKYVWLFSNLTYEQMMEMTEEYLANLGVTKGARHKLVLCIQKLKERYGVLLRLEKEILSCGGSRTQLAPVLDEMTNIVLTPMRPMELDQTENIAEMFFKLLDLIGAVMLTRPLCSPQEEETMNVYIWVLERALHNDAFADRTMELRDAKYKANKVKMAYAPKSHYAKNTNINGNVNKPRWSTTIKHKSSIPAESQKTPHRKSSLQYFSSPMQQSQSSQPQLSQSQKQSSLPSHLQPIPYPCYAHRHNPNAGTGHNNNYNKSSSYPNFASNMSTSGGNGSGSNIEHHVQHLQQQSQGQHQQLHQHQSQQQQQQQKSQPQPQQTHHTQQQQQPPHVPPPGNFMYHRHSLNNISAHQQQQQFLQQLQNQQQQQQSSLLPSIFLNAMSSSGGGGGGGGGVSLASKSKSTPTDADAERKLSNPVDLLGNKGGHQQQHSIGDINTRLEFLCLQMTEQAIN